MPARGREGLEDSGSHVRLDKKSGYVQNLQKKLGADCQ